MMAKEGSSKLENFMTPWAGVRVLVCGKLSHVVKMHYSFKNLLLYSHAYIRQIMCIVMMTKEGFTKIITFMTPGAGVRVIGCGHISIKVKMHNFFKTLLLYFQA